MLVIIFFPRSRRGPSGCRRCPALWRVSARNPRPGPFLFRAAGAQRGGSGAEGAGSGLPGALLQPCFSLQVRARRQHVAATGVAGRAVRGRAGPVPSGRRRLRPLCPAGKAGAALRTRNSAPGRGGADRAQRPEPSAGRARWAGAPALGLPLGRKSVSSGTTCSGKCALFSSSCTWISSRSVSGLPPHPPPASLLGWNICWDTAFPLVVLRILSLICLGNKGVSASTAHSSGWMYFLEQNHQTCLFPKAEAQTTKPPPSYKPPPLLFTYYRKKLHVPKITARGVPLGHTFFLGTR